MGKYLHKSLVIMGVLLIAAAAANSAESDKWETLKLPAECENLCIAESGKKLVLSLKNDTVVVLEVATRKFVRTFEVGESPTLIAASNSVLVIAKPETKRVEAFDLRTMKIISGATITSENKLLAMSMGGYSEGPLLATFVDAPGKSRSGYIEFWDPAKIAPLKIQGLEELIGGGEEYVFCKASPKGKMFVLNSRSNKTAIIKLAEGTGKFWQKHGNPGLVILDEDREGMSWNGQFRTFASLKPEESMPDKQESIKVPAYGAPLFLETVTQAFEFSNGPSQLDKHKETVLKVKLQGKDESICEIGGLPRFIGRSSHGFGSPPSADQRMLLLSGQKLLVILPQDAQSLLMRDFDLANELKEQSQDVLFVVSPTRYQAELAKPLTFKLEILSGDADPVCTLLEGPAGLSVSKQGEVKWTPSSRPLGGLAAVTIKVVAKSGKTLEHYLEIDVKRAGPTEVVSRIDANHLELAMEEPRLFQLHGSSLWGVHKGSQVALLQPETMKAQKVINLPKTYEFLSGRGDYFVGVSTKSMSIDVVDQKGTVVRSMKLDSSNIYSLALHPTEPLAYVAFRVSFDFPGMRFIVFDESTGKGRQSDEYVASALTVSPDGKYLIAEFHDLVQRGARILPNPGRWQLVPDYGSVSLMLRYNLKDPRNPELEDIIKDVAANTSKFSADGKQMVGVGVKGTGRFLMFTTKDFREIPTPLKVPDYDPNQNDFAFHPRLPIAASIGRDGIYFYDVTKNELLADKAEFPKGEFANCTCQRIFFTPDGKQLAVLQKRNAGFYLCHVNLKLTPEELAVLKAPARPIRSNRAPVSKAVIPLARLDAVRGGRGKAMTAKEISQWFSDSVVVVSGDDSSGSGFFVTEDGYVLTCAHCLPDGEPSVTYRLKVGNKLESRTKEARLICEDPDRDLALLKVDATTSFRPVRLDLTGLLESGESVTLISNPGLGPSVLENTVTTGVVSNVSRRIGTGNFIQTSAGVNAGSSGGPLFNPKGLVIGTAVAKAQIEGTAFAIPVKDITSFLLGCSSLKDEDIQIQRQWVDTTGEKILSGTLLEVSAGTVTLRKVDDSVVTIPISKLSTGDNWFLEQLLLSKKLTK